MVPDHFSQKSGRIDHLAGKLVDFNFESRIEIDDSQKDQQF